MAGKAVGHHSRQRQQAAGNERCHAMGRIASARLPHVAHGHAKHRRRLTCIDSGKVVP
jgi:hypothetical protein